MNLVIKYLKDHNGYARMKDMKAGAIHTREIQKLVDKGQIVKVKPGLYRLADLEPNEASALVEICLAMPKSVICLASALAYHELTTHVPPSVTFAIPRSDKPVKLRYPPNSPFYTGEKETKAMLEAIQKAETLERLDSIEQSRMKGVDTKKLTEGQAKILADAISKKRGQFSTTSRTKAA